MKLTGRSRDGLLIIDLDSLYALPRRLTHHSLWDVADVQWSPFPSKDFWIVSTSNQKALVWNLHLYSAHAPIEHVLHAHSRAITDINFSAHDPEMLATCAVDSFVHCWDLRHPAKPAMTFADWNAGATQVKWNRQDPNIIASSHDKYLKIWDKRKGANPLRTIEAHSTKIYGVDWNRTRMTGIVTCSLDRTIKFWDYSKAYDEPERVIRTSFPVWRARHTPFGWGVLAMPQRGDYDLHLYDRRLPDDGPKEAYVQPVHSFGGHKDNVMEFLWRSRGSVDNGLDNRDFQLISWSADNHVHLHRMDPKTLLAVGHKKGSEVRKKLNITRLGATYKSFRDEAPPRQPGGDKTVKPKGLGALISEAGLSRAPNNPIHPVVGEFGLMGSSFQTYAAKQRAQQPMNAMKWIEGVKISRDIDQDPGRRESKANRDTPESLTDELMHVSKKYKKVDFEDPDVHGRQATIALNGPWGQDGKHVFLRIKLSFPNDYPAARPEAVFEHTHSGVTDDVLQKLQTEIFYITQHYLHRRQGSLEAIITYLLGEKSLEQSISVKPYDDLDVPFSSPADESSSDEEDGLDAVETQQLANSGTDLAAQTNTPMARTSGALWAADGQLVCFFPPKSQPPPVFSLDELKPERNKNIPRHFEVFGRLRSESIVAKEKSMLSDNEDDNDSSGSYSASSASSSDESDNIGQLPSRFKPPLLWRAAFLRNAQKASSHSSGGPSKRLDSPKAKSVISIRDFSQLLPARRTLAEGYRVFGSGPSVCENNAKVAAQNGLTSLAAVWELCKDILSDSVPLEIMHQSRKRDPILVLARRNIVRIKRKDSGLDLGFDEPRAVVRPKLRGRVKWGKHPFASEWLIPALFDHYESLADVQMLAMLSCIFYEPAAQEGTHNALLNLGPDDWSIALKAPGFSLDYFPSKDVAWSQFREKKRASVGPTPTITTSLANDYFTRPQTTVGSASSSNGAWTADVGLHDGGTPDWGGNIPELSRQTTFTSSLSTSPDLAGARYSRRSNSSLSVTFAALAKPFTGSPPANDKSRVESDLSTSLPSGVKTWAGNTSFGSSSPNSPVQRRKSGARSASFAVYDSTYASSDDGSNNAPSDDEGAGPGSHAEQRGTHVKVALKNQHRFDDEGFASIPLLDPRLSQRYAAYREAYANLLSSWCLPESQAEVLKFNGLTPYWSHDPQVLGEFEIPTYRRTDIPKPRSFLKPTSAAAARSSSPGGGDSQSSPRKLSGTSSPATAAGAGARPLNPTAPPFVPQPQLFQAQGGIIPRAPTMSSQVDLHGILQMSAANNLAPPPSTIASLDPLDKGDAASFLSKEAPSLAPSVGQPPSSAAGSSTLLQQATDRARARGAEERREASRGVERACVACWELVFGLHIVCATGKHRAHMECIRARQEASWGGERLENTGIDCSCVGGPD
jgi:hypothetical protein